MCLDASFYSNKREKKKEHGFGWVGSGKNLGVGGGRVMVRTYCIKKSTFKEK